LVQSYLDTHPNKKRLEEDMKELDAKTPTEFVIKKGDFEDEEDDSEGNSDSDSESDSHSSSSVPITPITPATITSPTTTTYLSPFTTGTGFFSLAPMPVKCRECDTPGADGHKCAVSASHKFCAVCGEYVPDRGLPEKPVNCEICKRSFCDLYWGCKGFNGKGYLAKLSDHRELTIFSPPPESKLNTYEFNVIKTYITTLPKTVDVVFLEMLDALDASIFSYNFMGVHVTSKTIGCKNCANAVLGQLLYMYREKLIKKHDLPLEVTSRSDCHWGKNCRTQYHNLPHAQRFNHICEQTKF